MSPNVLRLPNDATSVRLAREFVMETIQGWGQHAVADIRLPTSEIVTNAVLYTDSRIELRVRRLDGRARVEVHDADPGAAELQTHPPGRVGGLGLRLVEMMASSWGVMSIEDDGKIVWFDMELRPDPS
jgi:anti-sigma regulatory factor (Ser/Thr protein kinase)